MLHKFQPTMAISSHLPGDGGNDSAIPNGVEKFWGRQLDS